jgi:hypothetical protein
MWTLPLVGEDIKQNQRRQWHSVTLPREHSPPEAVAAAFRKVNVE